MSSLQFEIQHRYRPAERLTVDHQRALVGSAAHCEIRLPPEDCSPEWAIFELRDGQLFIQPLGSQPQPMLEGRQLMEGPVPSGAGVQVGSCLLTVSVFDPTGGVLKKEKTNPRVFVLVGLLLAAAGYAATLNDDVDHEYALPDTPPSLWASDGHTCAQSEPGLAAARGYELLSSAESKRERSPFVPRAGVDAVSTYREAVACFRAAGKLTEASESEHDAARLETAMLRDYHLARLRLERALVSGDGDTALRQISTLKSMLGQRPGEYTASLNNLERRLVVRFGTTS